LQRYVTEKVYVDKKSGNIVAERTLLLKDGRKHRAFDALPIHIKDIVKMTEDYNVEVSSTRLSALASQLLQKSYATKRVESDLMMEYCMSREVQHGSSSYFESRTEETVRLLLSKTIGDQLVEYCLEAK